MRSTCYQIIETGKIVRSTYFPDYPSMTYVNNGTICVKYVHFLDVGYGMPKGQIICSKGGVSNNTSLKSIVTNIYGIDAPTVRLISIYSPLF